MNLQRDFAHLKNEMCLFGKSLCFLGWNGPLIVCNLFFFFDSLPQPITAVVAYIFVDTFSHLLAGGLGFAAGAMTWVSLMDLFSEAIETIGIIFATAIAIPSSLVMFAISYYIEN